MCYNAAYLVTYYNPVDCNMRGYVPLARTPKTGSFESNMAGRMLRRARGNQVRAHQHTDAQQQQSQWRGPSAFCRNGIGLVIGVRILLVVQQLRPVFKGFTWHQHGQTLSALSLVDRQGTAAQDLLQGEAAYAFEMFVSATMGGYFCEPSPLGLGDMFKNSPSRTSII